MAAGKTMANMPDQEVEQLVLDQLDRDPANRQGVRVVRHNIIQRTGKILKRDFVSNTMHVHNEQGFDERNPSARKIPRVKKTPIGIHERWSADGHDKLYKIRFPIYAIVDDATGKWLGAWVVPSNCTNEVVAYLYLCTVEKYGGKHVLGLLCSPALIFHPGIPLQTSTDCRSETTAMYGFAQALRSVNLLIDDMYLTAFSPKPNLSS